MLLNCSGVSRHSGVYSCFSEDKTYEMLCSPTFSTRKLLLLSYRACPSNFDELHTYNLRRNKCKTFPPLTRQPQQIAQPAWHTRDTHATDTRFRHTPPTTATASPLSISRQARSERQLGPTHVNFIRSVSWPIIDEPNRHFSLI